jgi:HSP20 family protein
MNLVRWDPFLESEAFFNRLMPNRLFNWHSLGNGQQLTDWTPSANISETESEYVIRAELPAIKKEDVQVTVENGVITIKGERKQQKEEKNEKYHRVESFYGNFERRFSLPDDVNTASIKCDSKEGILTVHIPKVEIKKSRPQQIAVQ